MTLPFETLDVDRVEARTDERVHALAEFAKQAGDGFWMSLKIQWDRYGRLSDKQWACVEREMGKRAMARKVEAVNTDFQPIAERLAAAGEHLKKPAILLADETGREFRFQFAPATGVNAGWLYVKVRGETDWGWGWAYYAKVNPATGKIMVAARYQDWLNAAQFAALMKGVMGDGIEVALRNYGRVTNNCGLCGRQLTEEVSVKSGVGPICAQRFGIDRAAIIENDQ